MPHELRDETERDCRAMAKSLLESFHTPVCVLDIELKPHVANAMGEAAFAEGRVLQLDERGRLRAADAAATRLIAEAVASVCRRPPAIRAEIAIRGADRNPLGLTSVLSLATPRSGAFCLGEQPLALLILYDLQNHTAIPTHALRPLFDLTAAEARVAERLVAGEDLDAIARGLNVSRETVRSHLHSLFAKTGCKRQAQLTAMLSRLARI